MADANEWVTGSFRPALTPEQQEAFYTALHESDFACEGETDGDGKDFVLGWSFYDQIVGYSAEGEDCFAAWLRENLPAGITARVELETRYTDDGAEPEVFYVGPGEREWRLHDLDTKIATTRKELAALQKQRDKLAKQVEVKRIMGVQA